MSYHWQIIFLCALFACLSGGECTKVVFDDVSPDITNNIFLYLIKGPNISDNVRVALEDGLTFTEYDFFNPAIQTVFYFHGWGEDINEESVVTIANAFLQADSVNLVILDYSVLVISDSGFIDYVEAFKNATQIGRAIGQYLQQYCAEDLIQPVSLLHLIGHSLGGQIMARTARTYGRGQLPWLTGLDPAGPLFHIPGVAHLSPKDAVFVDVIHTDGGFYGDYRSVGTVDFFPNGGTRVQPHCRIIDDLIGVCSHHMSWRIYAESIVNPTAFPARRCIRTVMCDINLALCFCRIYRGKFTYIGYGVNKSAVGNYFLTTNAESPFGRGEAGMDF